MAWWGTAAGRSIRRLWEDAHQGDDAAAERAQHVDAESRRRDVPRTADLQRREADEEGWGDEDGERYRAPAMYSTGRLTERQAETVNRWRARLVKGGADRPKASTSDVIAVCILDMLDHAPPTAQDIIWYAVATKQAHRAARLAAAAPAGQAIVGRDVPRFPPVTFSLPSTLADRFDLLRTSGIADVTALQAEAVAEARRRFPLRPMAAERNAYIAEQLQGENVPTSLPPVPPGTLARMAIDRWRRKAVAEVIDAAVDYSARTHSQHHRAHEDLQRLQR